MVNILLKIQIDPSKGDINPSKGDGSLKTAPKEVV
jgi:hypothetical protein